MRLSILFQRLTILTGRRGISANVNRYDYCILYPTPDRQHAQDLYWWLRDYSCKVFLDIEEIRAGMVWPHTLRKALKVSRVFLVLVSRHTDNAFYAQDEVTRAIELRRGKPWKHIVIPVLIEKLPQGTLSMPYGMSSLQAQDATRPGG